MSDALIFVNHAKHSLTYMQRILIIIIITFLCCIRLQCAYTRVWRLYWCTPNCFIANCTFTLLSNICASCRIHFTLLLRFVPNKYDPVMVLYGRHWGRSRFSGVSACHRHRSLHTWLGLWLGSTGGQKNTDKTLALHNGCTGCVQMLYNCRTWHCLQCRVTCL